MSSSIASVIAASVRKDKCLRPSGSGYCDFGTGSTFNFERTDSFTVYCWVRWSQASVGVIVARQGNVNSQTGWEIAVKATGVITLILKNANSPNQLSVDTVGTFNDGKWHSIIITYSGTSSPAGVHMYVDNVDQSLTTGTNTLTSSIQGTFNLVIGRDVPQATFQYTGDIGNLAILSGVVSSSDRTVLHNGRKPPVLADVLALSNLLGYWETGDGAQFPTISDRVSSNTGTMTSLAATDLRAYGPPYT